MFPIFVTICFQLQAFIFIIFEFDHNVHSMELRALHLLGMGVE